MCYQVMVLFRELGSFRAELLVGNPSIECDERLSQIIYEKGKLETLGKHRGCLL